MCSHLSLVTAPADHDLVAAMCQGDRTALATLYDRFAARLYGLALRVTTDPSDAEEVVTEAFGKAWREAATFDPARGSVQAWLVTMTRSKALDAVRARNRRLRLVDAASAAPDPVALGTAALPTDALVEADERAVRVRAALAHLPAPQREVLDLAYFGGLSQIEIAARLGAPLGTVKTRARLALLRLRELLAPLAPGAER
jgi:RNA polymerase sigma-70 factor (ECF subfamily)